VPEQRNLIGEILFKILFYHWLEEEYYSEQDPEKREDLKSEITAPGSQKWARSYTDKGEIDLQRQHPNKKNDLILSEARPFYKQLKSKLEQANKSNEIVLIQGGSASGREIAWFAEQFPELRCVGIDAFQGAITHASQEYSYENLEFKKATIQGAEELISGYSDENDVIMFTSGLFHFVQPEHAVEFFKFASKLSGFQLFLSEPVSLNSMSESAFPEESRPRKPFSWTHNYPKMIQEAGLNINEFKLTDHGGNPRKKHVFLYSKIPEY
jgi:hypothetical protein